MTEVTHNHAQYEERLVYVKELLADYLPHEQTEITPIAYDETLPFRYNNFVYRISLPSSYTGTLENVGGKSTPQQPGTVPVPSGCKHFILRLSNPFAEGMHQETRVQNEVGLLTLAADALQFMPGEPLLDAFEEKISLEEKRDIVAQVVKLLKALQDYRLPDSLKGWGGVTFDKSGAIVSAAMPSVGAGPWSSLEESYRGRFKAVLSMADGNPYMQGWRANGVRDRVEAFLERGIAAQFSDLQSKEDRVIVHADFSNPETGRITALLDFDFATISHPAYEFFRSFGNIGGNLAGWKGKETPEHEESAKLQKAQLEGKFPSPLPPPLISKDARHHVNWELAKAWNETLHEANARGPSSIGGIQKLADVDELLGC
ncbi:phosphotransferase enzyme family-domain-containing protein [Xylariaceae sp. FL0594]|nr:phosphotransferase enzyme family-domain-containing protein [Xylariaceae sp. FL0594]